MKITGAKIVVASIFLCVLATASGCAGSTGSTGANATPTPGAATAEPAITAPPVLTDGPGITPTQVGIRGQAKVDSVEVNVLGSSPPVKVQVVAKGYIQASCAKIVDVSQKRDGNTFTVTLSTFQQTDIICSDIEAPYQQTIDLEVGGLKAGTYTVIVDGVSKQFTLVADNP
jgi:hypothetical protein